MDEVQLTKVGATLFWCFHNKTNDASGKYQVDVGQLSEGAVEALTEAGLDVKLDEPKDDKPDRGYYVTCKSQRAIRVKDKAGESLDDTAIGNGTTATVVIGQYAWTFKGKKGVSASANSIVVKDLVEYEGGQADAIAMDDDEPEL